MADVSESIFELLHKEVKSTVETSHAGLRGKIVGRLADEKLKEREQLLFDGIRKYDELRRDAAKNSKADQVSFNLVDGKKVKVESYSEAAIRKKEAADKTLADFKNAYVWAIDGRLQNANGKWVDNADKLPEAERAALKKVPDFEPLKKALGKGGGGGSQQSEAPSGETEPTE